MTATNHALTGALIVVLIKKPELALPLAFLSHYALDALPHYNPRGVNLQSFKNYDEAYRRKFKDNSFLIIFAIDMLLFASILILSWFVGLNNLPHWEVFLGALLGASPDFEGGFYLLCQILRIKLKNPGYISPIARFHIKLQWMERPWGLYIEFVWFAAVLTLILKLGR